MIHTANDALSRNDALSQQHSKYSISISSWSNTDVNFGTKHSHISGNILVNLMKPTEHADQMQRVVTS